jgi:hypothetical protein
VATLFVVQVLGWLIAWRFMPGPPPQPLGTGEPPRS